MEGALESASIHMTASPVSTAPDGTAASERLDVLDVLRGIALLGMFLVHFNDHAAADQSAAASAYQRIVVLFFEERFWTMFGILFGIGFAVQLRRAEARGAAFVPRYVRRLLALAVFGAFSHLVFGYHVLLEYAVWGLPLLLVRTWPVKRLVVALVISAASWSAYSIARTSLCVFDRGDTACLAEMSANGAQIRAFRETNDREQDSPHYRDVLAARLRHMSWFYVQPYSFLPVNTFTLFLCGVIALRLGLLDRPQDHRARIVWLSVFGAAAWAVEEWLMAVGDSGASGPLVWDAVIGWSHTGFGLVRTMWLTFAYMGIVLLLVARDPKWLRRLKAFGWTGRMALTNYMLQVAVLDLTFRPYSLHLTLTPLQGLAAAIALFAFDAALSRLWLARFRFGPCEWLWRSITYGQLQPWRIEAPTAVVAAG